MIIKEKKNERYAKCHHNNTGRMKNIVMFGSRTKVRRKEKERVSDRENARKKVRFRVG